MNCSTKLIDYSTLNAHCSNEFMFVNYQLHTVIQYYISTSKQFNNGTTLLNWRPKIIVYVSCIEILESCTEYDGVCVDIHDALYAIHDTRHFCIVYKMIFNIWNVAKIIVRQLISKF